MYNSKNPYRPIETNVLDVITETPTIKTLKLKPKEELTFEIFMILCLQNRKKRHP